MGRNHNFNPFLFPSSTFSSASASASSSSSSFSSSFFSSPSSPSLNSPNAQPLSNLPFTHSSFSPSSASSAAILGPCAACKILHGYTNKCYPESHKYTVVDRVFGATNIAMFLQNDSSLSSYVPMLLLLRDTSQDGEVQSHPCRNYVVDTPNKGLENTSLSLGGMVAKDPPLDSVLRPMWFNDSSSMFPQSFGVPDMAFNSISNSSIAQPISQRIMRTYTKVYKRGSLARSIDITRFSGYDELKRELAMMFGIVGQLEDGQKVGWKLVYVDYENDILLVGNDPWEEFVNCVQSIKILSPQEVQLFSLSPA